MQTIKSKEQELLKTAIEATDAYLGVERQAMTLGTATPVMIKEFTYHLSRAHDALSELEDIDNHEEYMKGHIQKMIDLTPNNGSKAQLDVIQFHKTSHPEDVYETSRVSFKDFLEEENKTAEDSEEITDEDISKMVDELEWEDIIDLYSEDELLSDDEDQEEDEEKKEVKEALSIQARLKKRQAFARTRGKRNVARNMKLRRTSPIEVLKKRAVLAARRSLYKRFLRGRDKSTMSAAEKDRIEKQVAGLKYMQTTIANKMLPKMRDIEQKRLAGYRGAKK